MKWKLRLRTRRSRFIEFRGGSTRLGIAVLAAAFLVLCVAAFGQSAASSADAKPAAPAPLPHDQHSGLTVSVDPYTEAARTKDKFGKADPHDVGVLPIEVFLRNDSDQPMRVNLETVQLEVTLKNGVRQEVDWLRAEEVAQLIAHPAGAANPQQKRIPLPLPMKIGDKKAEKLAEVLRPLSLDADVIPPKATIHGFLYFDVSHEFSIASRSSLYVPDVSIAPGNEPLVFFEVPLRKAPAE
ncbi:MAG: hypothetical protein WCC03_03125 [Candidatus Acidiferrales bacterium]